MLLPGLPQTIENSSTVAYINEFGITLTLDKDGNNTLQFERNSSTYYFLAKFIFYKFFFLDQDDKDYFFHILLKTCLVDESLVEVRKFLNIFFNYFDCENFIKGEEPLIRDYDDDEPKNRLYFSIG